MSKRIVVVLAFGLLSTVAGPGRVKFAGMAKSGGVVNFIATDDVGPWFKCVGEGCVEAGTQSLAVVTPNSPVKISVGSETNTVHSFTSLLYPSGAQHMPFDQREAFRGSSRTVNLKQPGLYVFVCKIHPFMLAAAVVDDPATTGLDLGEEITLVNGIQVPTSSDLATRLLRAF